MKILLVHNSYQQPGGEDVVFEQERQLLERNGHRVTTYTRSNQEVKGISGLGQLALLKTIISSNDSKNEIRQIFRTEKPDLVHVHNTFMMISPSIYEACQEAGTPVLQTLHNYRLFCPAMFCYREGQICEECKEHTLLRGVWYGCYRGSAMATAAVALMLQVHRARGTWAEAIDGYIALTEFSRTKFIEAGLPAAKIHTKPNFTDPDPGERGAAGNYALFVGRLSPEKGVSTLIAAWNRMGVSIPLRIVGDGPLRENLEAEVENAGLRQVKFLGRLSSRETRAAMREAAFLIVPSRWYEGFPMVIVESFALGVPVLGSRLGSIEEIVAHRRTGLDFTPGDAEDLAYRVELAWSHPAELRKIGREARREYEARYTSQKNYAMLMEVYEQVLAKGIQMASPVTQ